MLPSTTQQNSTQKQAGQNPDTPQKQSIMDYSTGLPQDAKPLRSWSGNQAKMFFKRPLGILSHSKYISNVTSYAYADDSTFLAVLRKEADTPAVATSLDRDLAGFRSGAITGA